MFQDMAILPMLRSNRPSSSWQGTHEGQGSSGDPGNPPSKTLCLGGKGKPPQRSRLHPGARGLCKRISRCLPRASPQAASATTAKTSPVFEPIYQYQRGDGMFFDATESFYGNPPQLFSNDIAGFETSSRPYILKYGAPCHPDVIVR